MTNPPEDDQNKRKYREKHDVNSVKVQLKFGVFWKCLLTYLLHGAESFLRS